MKRYLNALNLTVIICAVLLSLYLFRPITGVSSAFNGLPLNQPRAISFDLNKKALDGKTRREQLDQMRDWLLYFVISESGMTAKEISDVLYDLPAVRQGYMQHVGNFEYGVTRSRLLGDGEVIALVPADRAEDRSDLLAHIADEHRKNMGEIPKSILVFEYDLNLSEYYGEITRRDAIDARKLFTPESGYVESTIKSTEDLKRFMGQIDDIAFARRDTDGLRLGGRKISAYQYRGISLEDIAAIWQSENKIQLQLKGFEDKWQQRVDAFNERWSKQSYRTELQRIQLESQRDREWEQLEAEQEEELKGRSLVSGSGFSLDPAYHFDKLKQFFETRLVPLSKLPLYSGENYSLEQQYPELYKNYPDLYSAEKDQPGAAEVSAALDRCDIEPFFDWLANFKKAQPELVKMMENAFSAGDDIRREQMKDAFMEGFIVDQQARYDGDLQGTEVGMVLFYTDLVAKLWDFDYKGSAPREISDFRSELEIQQHLSPVFRKQNEEMTYSRLWFGPDTRGYQPVNGGQSLLFARKATRLFAKSSDSVSQRDEVEPSASTALFINWWDDHYEEVARYEPQYERQNQIMKWSLLITWLNQANKGQYLDFLKDYTVNRSYRFPDWVKQQPDLKFNKWSDDMFLREGNKCTTTEVMPRLSSDNFASFGEKDKIWALSGGVSLGSRSSFEGRTILSAESKVAAAARRSGIDYAPLKSAENAIQTIEGASYKFQNIAQERVLITSTPKSGSMLRTSAGDLTPGSFNHVLAEERAGLRVTAKYGETEIGNLTIGRSGNGFKIGWESRDLDMSQSLARQMSSSAEPERLLANNPMINSAIKLNGNKGYLVKVRDSQHWTRIMSEERPSSAIGEGWQARFAESQEASKPINVAWWEQSRVQTELGNKSYLRIQRPGAGAKESLMEVVQDVPTSEGARINILSGESSIKAVADSKTESIFVRYSELPEYLQQNPGELQKALARADFSQMRLSPDRVIKIGDLRPINNDPLVQMLARENYGEAAQKLLKAPAEFKASLQKFYAEGLKRSDELFALGDYKGTQSQLNEMIQVYGPQPELTIRKGVALIKDGDASLAVRTFNESLVEGQVTNRAKFFDEINLRLKESGALKPGEAIRFGSEGPDLTLRYELPGLSQGTKVDPGMIDLDSAFVYIEDTPELSKLDWSTNIQATMKELVAGNLGEVTRLPKGDLTKFRPTQVYAADMSTTFKSARQMTTPRNIRLPVTIGGGQKCGSGDRADDDCNDVYFVVSRARL